MDAIPDAQGVIRTPSAGKFALLTPVDLIVIQCAYAFATPYGLRG